MVLFYLGDCVFIYLYMPVYILFSDFECLDVWSIMLCDDGVPIICADN